MQKLIFLLGLLSALPGLAQNTFLLKISDTKNGEPIIGATVTQLGAASGANSNIEGAATLRNIANGTSRFAISYVGYESDTITVDFPLADQTRVFEIKLTEKQSDLDEITIVSTRNNARIEDQATKIEVLGLEELNEENGIKPSNIASLLGDLSVIHIQQTSAVSGGSAIRMQGLDGKYTQLLRDGLPLYEGFTGGLGILQIPPLDLQQVEIIKGSVSTLYGSGAISGMINLVSKKPTAQPEWTLTANQSTLKESNINTYFATTSGHWGLTFFGAATRQQPIDVNKDGFSDIAKVRGLVVHPRLFWDEKNTHFDIGYSGTFEQRDGGDMRFLVAENIDSTIGFYEKNHTRRQTFDGHFDHHFSKKLSLSAKSAFSLLDLSTNNGIRPSFTGNFGTSFSDISLLRKWAKNNLVLGSTLVTQSFTGNIGGAELDAFNHNTLGAYVQDTWHFHPQWTLEGGFRVDQTNQFGAFYLPRISVLFKPGADWSIRLGSGSGYRLPDVFSDGGKSALPIVNYAKGEHSIGYNFDGNWHHLFFDQLGLTLNQAFYYVGIADPVVLNAGTLTNTTGSIKTLGSDTYIRLDIQSWELYLGYNHTLAQYFDANNNPENYLSYSPQDKFAMTAAYEIGEKWRFGIENAWVAHQYKNDGTQAKNYWFFAAMAERKFKHFAIVLNGENLGDFRQSRSEPLFDGSVAQPIFRSLWAPIDGRVINMSIKLNIL